MAGRRNHLSYCTNVHPADDLPGVLAQLDMYAVPIRALLGSGTDRLGLGLWLAAPVAEALVADPAERKRLRDALDSRGLEVVTLNGFPYTAFHAPVVKRAVYHPDWTTRARLDYTLALAEILADLLPDDAERGSISTLPLAWREPWDGSHADAAARRLDALAEGLAALRARTGRTIRVALEPEPGCIVETTGQAAQRLAGVDTEWLGVCLDLAHLACAWEEPREALDRLRTAGIPVVKVQVSAALEVADPRAAEPVLRRYVEPRFLHQTRSRGGGGTDDLDEAIEGHLPGPWRIHYHVPLHAAPEPPLTSTSAYIAEALPLLVGECDHFDVETYTWSVLPEGQRPRDAGETARGIAAELSYAEEMMPS